MSTFMHNYFAGESAALKYRLASGTTLPPQGISVFASLGFKRSSETSDYPLRCYVSPRRGNIGAWRQGFRGPLWRHNYESGVICARKASRVTSRSVGDRSSFGAVREDPEGVTFLLVTEVTSLSVPTKACRLTSCCSARRTCCWGRCSPRWGTGSWGWRLRCRCCCCCCCLTTGHTLQHSNKAPLNKGITMSHDSSKNRVVGDSGASE